MKSRCPEGDTGFRFEVTFPITSSERWKGKTDQWLVLFTMV